MPSWADIQQYTPMWFWAVFAFVLGASIGSFLNVVIYRLPRGKTVSDPPRSFCPNCETTIPWHDNIPILSYLLLGGRCRKCSVGISLQYPLVELLTALLFVGAAYAFGPTPRLLVNLIFVAALVALVFTDYFDHILPDAITIPGTVFALTVRFFDFNLVGIDADILRALLGPMAWIGRLEIPRVGSMFNAVLGLLLGGGSLWLLGVGYYRLRRFRLNQVEELGEFLCKDCVPGTSVRLHVRRAGRTEHIQIEAGDLTEVPAEELAEAGFKLFEEGDEALLKSSLSGMTTEKPADGTSPSGIVVASVPEGSFAAEYGFKPGDVITAANREGMGLGDVKMMFFVGAFLGWQLTFLTLFSAAIIGNLVTVYRLATQGRDALGTSVPFGVMLGMGALFALFFGEHAIVAYLNYALRTMQP